MTIVALMALAVVLLVVLDLQTSWLQSRIFAAIDRHLTYHIAPGPSRAIRYPTYGPYDWNRGYARLPSFLERLKASGFDIAAQARSSRTYLTVTRFGVFPIYRENDQAGLRILDRDGSPLFATRYPQRVYGAFDEIPALVVQTLLFIENRRMLDDNHPHRNPAVEWNRFSRAVVDYGIHKVDRKYTVIGGSTLATQLEKVRHSPEGRTDSAPEKLRQMLSASLRAYLDGDETLASQRRIVRDYVNSIPLGAAARLGEVSGLGDGLSTWYGADFDEVNRLLAAPDASLSEGELVRKARAYRETLSLLLALRAPSQYLGSDPKPLLAQTDRYLHALNERRVISRRLRDLALDERTIPSARVPSRTSVDFIQRKAVDSVRMSLLNFLGLDNTYALDRLDLAAHTTIDSRAQREVTQFLEDVRDPKQAEKAGLVQYRLLQQGNPESVIYSFSLYERTPGANLLRVQTDNYNQPLNINQNTRLELGSTAKLRVLVTYLELIEELNRKYASLPAAELRSMPVLPGDNLTKWALTYLATTTDRSIPAMIQAALDRKYSGNPGEAFYTGGGVHVFANYEPEEDHEIMTVRDAFHRSVNLVFIRLMRDIVHYYIYQTPGASPNVWSNPDDSARDAYLARFADQEGSEFLTRFYTRYRNQSPDEAIETLMRSIQPTPSRVAVIYRSVHPEASVDRFAAFLKAHVPAPALAREDAGRLYDKYGPDKFNLSDRGYLAHVHPLDLWLLSYLQQHPHATRKEALAASSRERQEVYWWLFKTRHLGAQNNRIWTLMEQDAFQQIYRSWKRQGYPFSSLVPSYATTIGVSGDTPAALSELVGIILNNGVRNPSTRIDELHFAQGTPSETILRKRLAPGERVFSAAIAEAVRREMIGVVQEGTAMRARRSVVLPNGVAIPVGGKTGTGDNRRNDKVVSRTAAFVFFIGDRFFGTVVAYVPGQSAGGYRFSSALTAQIFKDLAPSLMPMIERPQRKEPEALPQLALATSASR